MPKPHSPGLRRWVGRLTLPLVLLLPLIGAGASLTATPDAGEPVAALFPPSYSREATLVAVSATGAKLVAPGGMTSVFIVQSDEPGLPDRLRQAGAWFVFSSRAAAWCQ